MNRIRKILTIILCVLCAMCLAGAAGCIEPAGKYVTDIQRTETDTETVFVIEYSDNTKTELPVPKAGADGQDGIDGKDGKDLTVDAVYQKYVELYGEMSYKDFLKEYLPQLYYDNNACVGELVLSSVKIHAEFITRTSGFMVRYDTAMASGSGVIWSMSTAENGYTYIVTNYHVIYENAAETAYNGGTKLARKITCYVFGSEISPVATTQKDEDGYTVYNYGSYAIECEYVGGAINSDIAVIRAKTSDILAINDGVKPVTPAQEYRLGEKAIAVGNAENWGISVTEGILSVIDDNIKLSIDGTSRDYRSLRIDTPIYEGNSGGGLFNGDGELIGITNAGATGRDSSNNVVSLENISYAIPLEIVTATVENILYYYSDKNPNTNGAYKLYFGFSITETNLKYVYDSQKGYGKSVADVTVTQVTESTLAKRQSLAAGDIIKAVILDGKRYEIDRMSDIPDVALYARPDLYLKFEYIRNGVTQTSAGEYLIFSNNFVAYA